MIEFRASRKLMMSNPPIEPSEGLSNKPAGRGWILLGVLATLIGVALGLIMSSVGS
jgi:hypothetical protein